MRAWLVVLELNAASLEALAPQRRAELAGEISGIFAEAGLVRNVRFAPYRNGNAFLVRGDERA